MATRQARHNSRRRAANRAAGLCPCGKNRAPGRMKCEGCLEADRRHGAAYRARGRIT